MSHHLIRTDLIITVLAEFLWIRSTSQLEHSLLDPRSYARVFNDKNISFDVEVINDTLIIISYGLLIVNETLKQGVKGCTVINSEAGDLKADGYPEVLVIFHLMEVVAMKN